MTGQVQTRAADSATGMSVQDADLITIGTYPTIHQRPATWMQVVRLMSNYNMIKLSNAPAVPPMIVSRAELAQAQGRWSSPSCRAMTMRWTSDVPSPISSTLASR